MEFKDVGFNAEAANIGNGRIVEIGDEEFGFDRLFKTGTEIGEEFRVESGIQFGTEGEFDLEACDKPVDFVFSSESEGK